VGSSRPRNTYSMMATTSGMLARKQMMVSTGTYCRPLAPRHQQGHGSSVSVAGIIPCCDQQQEWLWMRPQGVRRAYP
jgi:hypothetical protein